MESITPTTGTTLAILAPYLPYGIEVESVNREQNERQKLIGLCYNAVELVNCEWEPLRNYWYGAAHCLPVLRPFRALCDPLPDGTVPVSKLARMMFDDMVGEGGEVSAGFDHFGHAVVTESGGRVLSISPDWEIFAEDGLRAGLAEYQQLLKWHFAVGLNPTEFIEKV